MLEHLIYVPPRLGVLDYLPASRMTQSFVGKVVGGRPQTAGGEHEVRPGCGLGNGSDEAPFVVSDGSVAVDRHTQSREPTAEPSRVRVHEATKEYLGPDGYYLGAHRVQIVHAV